MTTRRGLVWPLVLIVIGSVFLGANLGLWSGVRLVDVVMLWPLLLVLLGLELALAHRHPVTALLSELAVLALAVVLIVLQPVYPQWFAFGPSRPGGASAVSVPRGSATALSLRLTGGAGTFTVHGGATDLVNVTSDDQDLVLETTGSNTVTVRVDQGRQGPRFGTAPSTHVDARVASDVPASIGLDAGAGEFTVDLSDVKTTDARLSVGAASLRLVLPKPSGNVTITVSAGASSLVIEVPAGVEASITTTGALMSVRSENPRVSGTQTSGYASASDRVTVRVTAGASSVVIR